jgi:hypothetical protein
LEDTRRLAALRDQIALLEGETVFEGWAAGRVGRVDRQPGLALLTNLRLIVADISGGFSAVPIAKIDRIDLPSPTTVRLTAWYEAISLSFESAAAAATLVNCLRQDPECLAAIRQGMDLIARPPCEIAAADAGPDIPIWPTSTIDPTPHGPVTESADQRLLMAKPSL